MLQVFFNQSSGRCERHTIHQPDVLFQMYILLLHNLIKKLNICFVRWWQIIVDLIPSEDYVTVNKWVNLVNVLNCQSRKKKTTVSWQQLVLKVDKNLDYIWEKSRQEPVQDQEPAGNCVWSLMSYSEDSGLGWKPDLGPRSRWPKIRCRCETYTEVWELIGTDDLSFHCFQASYHRPLC